MLWSNSNNTADDNQKERKVVQKNKVTSFEFWLLDVKKNKNKKKHHLKKKK